MSTTNITYKGVFPSASLFMGHTRGAKYEKVEFKVFRILCCRYSQLVSRDAWKHQKWTSSIQSSRAEKMSNYLIHIGRFLNSRLSVWLDSFVMFKASWTQVYCPPTYCSENFKFLGWLPLWDPLKYLSVTYVCFLIFSYFIYW